MDNTPTATSRRRHPRRGATLHNKVLRGTLNFEDGRSNDIYFYLVDLSEGGMRINLERELPSNEEFEVTFTVPGLKSESGSTLPPFAARVRVAWQKDLLGGTWVAGLQFTDVPESSRKTITYLFESGSEQSRRMHVRLHDDLYIRLRRHGHSGAWYSGVTSDISPIGLLVSLLPQGDGGMLASEQYDMLDVELLFEQPSAAVAQVMWQRDGASGRELGLRFTSVPDESGRLLREYISQLASKPKNEAS